MARIYIRNPVLLVPSRVPFLLPCATVHVVPEPFVQNLRRTFAQDLILASFLSSGFITAGTCPATPFIVDIFPTAGNFFKA